MAAARSLAARWWHRRQEDYSVTEIVIDAVVHGIGIVLAVAAGSVLLVFALAASRRKSCRPCSSISAPW